MQFSMMAIDGNRLFDACKRFLVMNLESLEKLQGMDCSVESFQEALGMFCNHATNLYVCGLIDEEFYRLIVDGIVENDAMEGLVTGAKDIRKDIVCHEDKQKIF